MKKALLTAGIGLFLFKSQAQNKDSTQPTSNLTKVPSDTSVTMAAGTQYKASGWKKLWWGKHWRKEWITPVTFPMINLSQFHGGLTPIKAGGGHQTKTLRMMSGEGKEYVLRTIDKTLDVLIPEELKNTFINDLVNDQISSAHPYGPLAIAKMADELSIYHTNPVIVFVPDAPELEEFRMEFANKLCLLEERPSGKGWEHDPIAGNADDIVNTEKLIEKVEGNTKNRVDQYELLKVRLFDMIVNDWDRHEDQWVWSAHEVGKETIYTAFGRDRDQSFSKTDGIAMYFLSRRWAFRPLQNMTPEVRDLAGANFSARNLDRQFLNELRKDQWQEGIAFVQSRLTDTGIRKAVYTMPPEVNQNSGEWLVKRLIQRRDNLPGYSMKYYSILAKKVNIAGSEKKEQFIVDNRGDDEIAITGLRSNNDTFYHRVFFRNETKEINLYGLDGDDDFTFTGTAKNKFIVRVIGGMGNNNYASTKESNGGKKIRVYDTLYNQDLTRRAFRINKKSDSLYRYNRKGTKYDYYLPLIIPGYNPDDGLVVGLGLLYRKQKWGKTPYGWQQRLTVTYATQTGALGFAYKGTWKQTFGKADFDMEAYFKGPRYVLNYYGLGNNTELNGGSKSYFRVRSKILYFSPGISRSWKYSWIRAGLQVQTVNILDNNNKFVGSPQSDVDPAIFSNRTYAGANTEWFISSLSSTRYPQNGIYFNPGVSYWHETLGFPGKWKWGDPPNHGGVSWQKVFIQFSLEPGLASASKGNSIWIKVQHIDSLYQFHQEKKVPIVYSLATQPWGMAQYTVRDNNGYFIHFAEPAEEREKQQTKEIPGVTILLRKPTVEECITLERESGNESGADEASTAQRLAVPLQGVVAQDPSTNRIIGYALLLGDNISYYYIKDVLVHPAWRGKGVGTTMMRELDNWLMKYGAKNALVALICRETLAPFYQQFGFAPAFSMIKYLHRV